MDDLVGGYYQLCVWVTRFAYVNVLWILFTLLGFVLFGVMPSTVAMFAVIRKWVNGDSEVPIFKTFLEVYRVEFLKSNILGYVFLAVGAILYIDLYFLRTQEGLVNLFLTYGILVLFFIYFVMLLFIFPIFVHFELKFKQYITWPLIIGVIHPIVTIGMIIGTIVAFYVLFKMLPALALFFGGSVMAFILMWGSTQTFAKFESAKE